MTVSSTTNRVDYTGNGATTVYPYTFKIFDDSELRVTTRDTDDQETTLVLDTDYTVSGVGNSSGGNVTLTTALASSYRLTIRRVRPLTQTTDIRNNGDFYPESHEDAFDKLLMIDQQQQQDIDRAFVLPETYSATDVDTTLPIPVAERLIGWNADGDGLSNYAAAGNLAVSAFMESVLDDTTASAARTTLDSAQELNSLTAETAPAAGDLLYLRDISVPANRKMTLENALKVVNSLTEDTVPASGDMLLTYDVSASGVKKVTLTNAVNVTLGVRPAFEVHRNGVVQNIANGAATKVQWTTEVTDTNSNFDSSTNYRFTPTVAGYYSLHASIIFDATVDTGTATVMIYKNGSEIRRMSSHASTNKVLGAAVSTIVYANGSSDYFEVYAAQDSGSSQDLNGNATNSSFSGCRLA